MYVVIGVSIKDEKIISCVTFDEDGGVYDYVEDQKLKFLHKEKRIDKSSIVSYGSTNGCGYFKSKHYNIIWRTFEIEDDKKSIYVEFSFSKGLDKEIRSILYGKSNCENEEEEEDLICEKATCRMYNDEYTCKEKWNEVFEKESWFPLYTSENDDMLCGVFTDYENGYDEKICASIVLKKKNVKKMVYVAVNKYKEIMYLGEKFASEEDEEHYDCDVVDSIDDIYHLEDELLWSTEKPNKIGLYCAVVENNGQEFNVTWCFGVINQNIQ